MRAEAARHVYDQAHATEQAYTVPVERSFYYPMFARVVDEVRIRNPASILEVGCGSGGLADLLTRLKDFRYRGFDFSPVAIRNARDRYPDAGEFFVGDALDPASYAQSCDMIVCTEVLEHMARDLDAMAMWLPGTDCVCSVPNFDYPTHVRYFRHERDVLARYGHVLDIESIRRVAKPLLTGKTLRQYFRQLRWAREQPTRMLGLLGFNTFDWYAGWFVFAGKRRAA
jgi:2-polyprenyl-3-methyl-5-hydroxy-6-metoxy-1,4-benzoquinol methylase